MKLLASFVVIFLLVDLSAAADELTLAVPPLLTEQPIITSIYRLGSRIIVSTERYDRNEKELHYSFWQLDEEKNRFIPLINKDGERVVAVSENGFSELIASSTGNKLHLNFIDQPTRSIFIAESGNAPFRLSANDDFTFLVFADRIAEVSRKGTVREIKLDGVIAERWGMLPRAIAATKDELLLGYDKGEWRGGLYSVRISKEGLAAKSTRLLSKNVCAIDQDSKGKIWIASGLAHMVLREAGLHLYDGKTITPIFSERSFGDKKDRKETNAVISLPKPTEIGGITVNSKDEVVIVASEVGLFSYAIGKPLSSLWEGNLHIRYPMPDYSVGSPPQGIVQKGNNLYVASRSLGVFCFETLGEGKYVPTKQITFEKISSNKADAGDGK